MNPDLNIIQLLSNSSGSAVVAALFLWYLIKRDHVAEAKDKRINDIINSYLKEANKTRKDLTKTIQKNIDVLESLEKKVDGKFSQKKGDDSQ